MQNTRVVLRKKFPIVRPPSLFNVSHSGPNDTIIASLSSSQIANMTLCSRKRRQSKLFSQSQTDEGRQRQA